eukprot:4286894-Amphidinium_carterae.4
MGVSCPRSCALCSVKRDLLIPPAPVFVCSDWRLGSCLLGARVSLSLLARLGGLALACLVPVAYLLLALCRPPS